MSETHWRWSGPVHHAELEALLANVADPDDGNDLLFATDFDGPLEAHLDELLERAGPRPQRRCSPISPSL